ncbi:MAG: hypothetical protein K0S47_3700 [Herbinix sp.]|jgi:hypothetical protein|nr:hypothetical protein [Herbinix sp.]
MSDYNDQNGNDNNQQPVQQGNQQPYQYQQPGNQQPGYQQYPNYQQEEPPKKNSGMAIASMVIGICSIVLCCVWYLALPASIVGLVLGILSIRGKKSGRGMAIAGIILCSLGIVIALLLGITVLVVGNSINPYELEEYFNSLGYDYNY